ncbi:SH3 domain-containing protein [Herbidospora cretacea]|uniref:SH3 domain-containing protein n=1 Tax=Herbidospora cretacea TaxID=28444 RepID=UPI0004C3D5F9|nr:SH3 domain-containing protein [Herbidospora cretacea]
MDLVKPAVLATATVLCLALPAGASTAATSAASSGLAVTSAPSTVHAGQTVRLRTKACPNRPGYAYSPAWGRSVTLLPNGVRATGRATVWSGTKPGTYSVSVACQGQTYPTAFGYLTVVAAGTSVKYRVQHVRKGSHLNVRSGPGLGHRVVGKLKWKATVQGSPVRERGWVKVTTKRGTTGWSYGYYLRRA